MTPRRNSPAGFTLIEILIVVIIIGVLAGMLFPSFRGVVTASKDNVAITKAEALNSATFTYAKRIPNAAANWAAANNAGRYDLLYDAGYLPNCPTSLAAFQPNGYSFSFPTNVTGRIAITGPAGAMSY